jgi:hypothetical protein
LITKYLSNLKLSQALLDIRIEESETKINCVRFSLLPCQNMAKIPISALVKVIEYVGQSNIAAVSQAFFLANRERNEDVLGRAVKSPKNILLHKLYVEGFDTVGKMYVKLQTIVPNNYFSSLIHAQPQRCLELMGEAALRENLELCNIDQIPEEVFLFKNLKILKITKSNLSSIPEGIAALKNLECLILSDNQFKTVPSVIGKLPRLKELDLTSNKITEISKDALSLFKNLSVLFISRNPLDEDQLAEEISQNHRLANLVTDLPQVFDPPI